ncbi:MAG: DUF2281 domain-containing protein [Mariniphaga sp.]|nr:DUF2281 domain-containing protein [Mariniphaga sp.]
MNEFTLKYNLLDTSSKQEVLDFIHFLLEKKSVNRRKSHSLNKKQLLKVSVWTDDEIEEMNKNLQKFNQWKIQEW